MADSDWHPNPKDYVEFYKQHGYSFLPQSLIDRFLKLISAQLLNDRTDWTERLADYPENPTGKDLLRHVGYHESRIDEVDELQFLAAELVILGLYRFIEIERNRVLIERFSPIDPKHLRTWHHLSTAFPFLRRLFGSDAIDELRLICNCIKHSGRVSRELAKYHHGWREGERLSELGAAYKRLAPFVGAYWIDFVCTARDIANEKRTVS
jgi:thymidine kinase